MNTEGTKDPAELAAEAALLDARRARLSEVRDAMKKANDDFSAGVAEVHRAYAAAAGPLDAERKLLEEAVATSEAAAEELDERRCRVAELRDQLAAAEATLPPS